MTSFNAGPHLGVREAAAIANRSYYVGGIPGCYFVLKRRPDKDDQRDSVRYASRRDAGLHVQRKRARYALVLLGLTPERAREVWDEHLAHLRPPKGCVATLWLIEQLGTR